MLNLFSRISGNNRQFINQAIHCLEECYKASSRELKWELINRALILVRIVGAKYSENLTLKVTDGENDITYQIKKYTNPNIEEGINYLKSIL